MNLCLLEEQEVREIKALVDDGSEWLRQWFEEIREFKLSNADKEKVTRLHYYGVSYHLWSQPSFNSSQYFWSLNVFR